MNFPIPQTAGQPYDSKPQRTGTFVLTSSGWLYTAKPEDLRKHLGDQQRFPFYITPAHMRPDDSV